MCVQLAAHGALAERVVLRGEDGAAGTLGALGERGGEGGAGSDVTAIAEAPTSDDNRADAIGGRGGLGGRGGRRLGVLGSPGDGGDGGRGGNAEARATTVSTGSHPLALAGADGGNGGVGGEVGLGIPPVGSTSLPRSGRGGRGGDATADASLDATTAYDGDPRALASATSSSGAAGGRGGASTTGPGGAGGDAVARSEVSAGPGDGSRTASARAVGGTGGGSTESGSGGAGGDAEAIARIDSVGGDRVEANAYASGGVGGRASGPGEVGGHGGDATAFAQSAAIGPEVRLSTRATARGGDGGAHESGPLGRGGDGGDATIDTVLSHDSSARVSISQLATGGSGGGTVGRDYDGAGGDATSRISLDTHSESVSVTLSARPGASSREGLSGTARIGAEVAADGAVAISAEASPAGDGELELGPILGQSRGGEAVEVGLRVLPGLRAFERRDGRRAGRSFRIENAVRAETSGDKSLGQRVDGGDGAFVGTDADGGHAVSRLSEARSLRGLRATSAANGGDGAGSGDGGDATADLTAEAGRGELVARSLAEAGRADPWPSSGNGGDAVARLRASQGPTDDEAEAEAIARAGSAGIDGVGGNALAEASLETASTSRASVLADAWGGGGPGEAGAGGRATSAASLRAEGPGRYEATARAFAAGGAFGGEGRATARVEAENGTAVARVEVAGGASTGSTPEGAGLDGQSVSAEDWASGVGRVVHLDQRVYGGQGGHASEPGRVGGNGGDAVSDLEVSDRASEAVHLEVYARGGRAGYGNGPGTVGGRGGNAEMTVVAERVSGRVTIVADGRAGSGGFRESNDEFDDVEGEIPSGFGADGGRGGDVTFGRLYGESLSGDAVSVTAIAHGGDGGNGSGSATQVAHGGSGASVHLDGVVEGRTTGELTLVQEAAGGDGGRGANGGRGGDGGDATSALQRDFSQASVSVRLGADAGEGGRSIDGELGEHGAAHVRARLTQSGGDLTLVGRAEGVSWTNRLATATVDLEARLDGDGHRLSIGENALDGARNGRARSRSVGTATGNSEVVVYDQAVGNVYAGSAESHARGSNGGDAPVLVHATAIGGTRGESEASAFGSSTGGGEVTVVAEQVGGDGAWNSSDPSLGGGLDSNLVDAVEGRTRGRLVLRQVAVGGRTAIVGQEAGGGRSELFATNPGGGAIEATSEARGGLGGGSAFAFVHARDEVGESVVARAIATGGRRWRLSGGGSAAAEAVGESTAAGNVEVVARVEGGRNASTRPGVDVRLDDAVRGRTKGRLTLRQEAIGGAGYPIASPDGTKSTGDAHSLLEGKNPLGGDLHVESIARGGSRPPSSFYRVSVIGGDAFSRSSGSVGGKAVLQVSDEAHGGDGFVGGRAHSRADGRASGFGPVEVRSLAVGGTADLPSSGVLGAADAAATAVSASGVAEARADARAGRHRVGSESLDLGVAALERSSIARASAFAKGRSGVSEARASGRSGGVGEREILVSAMASASGDAARGLAVDALAGAPVSGEFGSKSLVATRVEGVHERSGEWTRGGFSLRTDDTGLDIVLRSAVEVQVSAEQAAGAAVFVSFLEFDTAGRSRLPDTLRFGVRVDDVVVVDRGFANDQEASEFFASALSLGQLLPAGSDGPLLLEVFVETSARAKWTGLSTRFSIGTIVVPEPSVATLLLLGLIAFARGERVGVPRRGR